MKRVCCYCKKSMGQKPPYKDKRTTHGVCGNCFLKVIAEYEKMKGRGGDMVPGSGNSIATCIHGNYAPCEKCREDECVDIEDEEEDNDDDNLVSDFCSYNDRDNS